MLPDDQIEKYISKAGDRCRVRRFCGQFITKTAERKSRNSFMEKLRDRMSLGRRDQACNDEKRTRSGKLRGNFNARKELRKIEIGWLDYCSTSCRYIQVRSRQGGGTRDV